MSFLKKLTLKMNIFGHDVGILAISAVFGQGIVLLLYPLLTRLYTPSDFGMLGIYTSFLSLFTVVASFRYEIAIPLANTTEDALCVVKLSLFLVLGVTIGSAIVVWFVVGFVTNWMKITDVKSLFWLLPIGVLGTGAYQVFNYWAIRQERFKAIGRTKITQSIGQVISQTGLGILEAGSIGLMIGQCIGQTLGVFSLAKDFRKLQAMQTGKIEQHGIRRMLIRYRRFPLISGPSALLNSAGLQIPTMLFAAFYNPSVAGWFNLGQRVVALPVTLIGTAFAQVYLAQASKLIRDNPQALLPLFKKTATKLLLVGGLPALLLGTTAPWIFQFVFGSRWHEAGLYVQVLAIAFVAQFAIVPLSQTLNVIERQDVQLAWDVGRLFLVLSALFSAHYLRIGSTDAVILYSVSMLISYLSLFWLSLHGLSANQIRKHKTANIISS